jgi:ankyrin repeat protein
MSSLSPTSSLGSELEFALAFREQDVDTLKRILNSSADKELIDRTFKWSCQGGQTEIIQLLLNSGFISVSPDIVNEGFRTACGWQRPEVMKLFMSYGADVNTPDEKGQTPLMYALWSGMAWHSEEDELETFRLLLERGASVTARDHEGRSVMGYAAYAENNLTIFKLLIARGADIKEVDAKGKSLMDIAFHDGRILSVKSLIECGFDFKPYLERLLNFIFSPLLGNPWPLQKRLLCCMVEHGLSLDTSFLIADRECASSSIRSRLDKKFGKEAESIFTAETHFKTWERRKDFLSMMLALSHQHHDKDSSSTSESVSAGAEAGAGAAAGSAETMEARALALSPEDFSITQGLATVFHDPRMLKHGRKEEGTELKCFSEYAGYVAMFL